MINISKSENQKHLAKLVTLFSRYDGKVCFDIHDLRFMLKELRELNTAVYDNLLDYPLEFLDLTGLLSEIPDEIIYEHKR